MVDASALAKYVLHEEDWDRIGVFVRDRRPLCSMDHVVKEIGNALWRHCWLKGAIDKVKAVKLYQAFLNL